MAKKILLVDDDEDFVAITKSQAQKGGFDVEVAYSGEECLEKAQKDKPDLILLDIKMPGKDGYDTCTELKSDENTKAIPVILWTAMAKDREKEAGADKYISKPANFESLLKSINELIDIFSNTIRKQVLDSAESAHPDFKKEIVRKEKELKPVFPRQRELLAKASSFIEGFTINKILADGTRLILRPIKPADNTLLKDFFNALPEESIAFPKFEAIKELPQKIIWELLNIDYSKDMAIGALTEGNEHLTGIIHYSLNNATNSAEVSVVVRDEWRNKGIESCLLETVADIAQKRSVTAFEAHVFTNREQFIPLFYNTGCTVAIKKGKNVFTIRYDIKKKWSIHRKLDEKNRISFKLDVA